ncbi:MAG: c-type cytochrome domain-containing protein [Thalassotalea sp.]
MDLIQFFGRFHVLVLHLPIGILMLSALLELHTLYKKSVHNPLINWIWFWGGISATGACVLGWMLSQGEGYTAEAVFIHRSFGISVAVTAFICWLYFKQVKSSNKINRVLGASFASIQLLLLFSTGHYGANMTHGETYLVDKAPDLVRVVIGLAPHPTPRPPIESLADADVYLDVIAPMMKQRCTGCHNDSKQKGKLNLANINGLTKGGRSGHTIVAGKPNESELYQRITMAHNEKKFMPAEGKTPFTEQQVKAIAWWIKAGAPSQGTVASFISSPDDSTTMRALLNLHDQNSLKALPKIANISNEQAASLVTQGFVVKNIAKNINYLDLDLSISGQPVTDEMINYLLTIKEHIVWLNLAKSNISPAQLAKLAELPNLMKLRLEYNPLTTQDILPLSALPKLGYLNLYSTQVDDSLLAQLTEFKALKQVYLTQTNVAVTAVAEFLKSSQIKVNYVLPDSVKSAK